MASSSPFVTPVSSVMLPEATAAPNMEQKVTNTTAVSTAVKDSVIPPASLTPTAASSSSSSSNPSSPPSSRLHPLTYHRKHPRDEESADSTAPSKYDSHPVSAVVHSDGVKADHSMASSHSSSCGSDSEEDEEEDEIKPSIKSAIASATSSAGTTAASSTTTASPASPSTPLSSHSASLSAATGLPVSSAELLAQQLAAQAEHDLEKNGGGSCHQCKTARPRSQLLVCTRMGDRSRKRRCRKKFCHACLMRSYGINAPTMKVSETDCWLCPACTNTCICAACGRRGQPKPGVAGPSIKKTNAQAMNLSSLTMGLPPTYGMSVMQAGAGWPGAGAFMLPSQGTGVGNRSVSAHALTAKPIQVGNASPFATYPMAAHPSQMVAMQQPPVHGGFAMGAYPAVSTAGAMMVAPSIQPAYSSDTSNTPSGAATPSLPPQPGFGAGGSSRLASVPASFAPVAYAHHQQPVHFAPQASFPAPQSAYPYAAAPQAPSAFAPPYAQAAMHQLHAQQPASHVPAGYVFAPPAAPVAPAPTQGHPAKAQKLAHGNDVHHGTKKEDGVADAADTLAFLASAASSGPVVAVGSEETAQSLQPQVVQPIAYPVGADPQVQSGYYATGGVGYQLYADPSQAALMSSHSLYGPGAYYQPAQAVAGQPGQTGIPTHYYPPGSSQMAWDPAQVQAQAAAVKTPAVFMPTAVRPGVPAATLGASSTLQPMPIEMLQPAQSTSTAQ